MIVFEKRASTVLYNYLMTTADERTYLLPANSCPVIPLTFFKAGKKFEFVDISEQTLCMNEDVVLEKVRKRRGQYGGVLFIHTYGVEDSYDHFFREIKEIDDTVSVIDDKCLCKPDLSGCVSPHAELVLYSTGYGKYCDTGSGGFGVINARNRYDRHSIVFKKEDLMHLSAFCREAVEKKTVRSCDLAWLDTGDPEIVWEEYRKRVADQFAQVTPHKEKINQIYAAGIPSGMQLDNKYQNWRFTIRVPRKERLLEKIFTTKLFASSHYLSLNGIFSNGRSSRAERLHGEVINLFNDLHFDTVRAEHVVEIVLKHVNTYGNA